MIHRNIQLFTAAVILVMSAAVMAAPQIGEPAPDFSVVDTKGKVHSLSDYAGKTVVLEWTNHECPFVAKHYGAGNMQDQQRTARNDHDVVWLSVISSKPGAQGHISPQRSDELTAERDAYPNAVLIDESGEMGHAYDARVTPHMYIIDADGILRYMGGIDSIPSADQDDIPEATQYVMVALDEMAAGEAVSQTTTRPYGCTVKY
ncbi:thioredoxin family protein [Wenzhouxiangella sediminis]|uniref:Thioredoxin family protein n=1 Tax=Wenzhouxiangella sediminis TaxID=1792836 RepID=A0A3E1KB93_9GAMM|nr:thioredoxin family protein [Wenzhouxiangella sediminis]RFF31839.1 thioredoxin family protein [Wenzhouxiangella sediminis]